MLRVYESFRCINLRTIAAIALAAAYTNGCRISIAMPPREPEVAGTTQAAASSSDATQSASAAPSQATSEPQNPSGSSHGNSSAGADVAATPATTSNEPHHA